MLASNATPGTLRLAAGAQRPAALACQGLCFPCRLARDVAYQVTVAVTLSR